MGPIALWPSNLANQIFGLTYYTAPCVSVATSRSLVVCRLKDKRLSAERKKLISLKQACDLRTDRISTLLIMLYGELFHLPDRGIALSIYLFRRNIHGHRPRIKLLSQATFQLPGTCIL